MNLLVRHWVIDHWSDWMPADRDVRRSLDLTEYRDLQQGETITRHGGYQQVIAEECLPVSEDGRRRSVISDQ